MKRQTRRGREEQRKKEMRGGGDVKRQNKRGIEEQRKEEMRGEEMWRSRIREE